MPAHSFASERVTVASAAVTLTSTKYAPNGVAALKSIPVSATIRVDTAPIRFDTTGATPTSTQGVPLNPSDVLVLDGYYELTQFKAIASTATTAYINAEYAM